MRFSERIGEKNIRTVLQIDSIDETLRIKIWNLIHKDLFLNLERIDYKLATLICKEIWTEFFDELIDETPPFQTNYDISFQEIFKNRYFKELEWSEIYDFLEFISKICEKFLKVEFSKNCNSVLKSQLSGYRLINYNIIKTTSEEEIEAIETAIEDTTGMNSVNIHLNSALELLSNRETPDYRNSIKESISAVEAICSIITNNKKATLGDALKIIEKEHEIHKSLKNAFSNLYGFTSDAGGIRHKLLEDDISISFEDAKFMLVSCSAFINYLKEKIEI